MRTALRFLAVPVAIALFWPIGLGTLLASFAMGSGLKAPNPFVPDRSFDDTPDTWGQAFGWIAGSLVAWLLVLTAFSVVMVLSHFAMRGRLPSARFFATAPTVGMAILVVIYAIVLIPKLGKGRTDAIDCRTFHFNATNWKSEDPATHYEAGFGAAECGSLTGKTRAQLIRLLQPQSIDPPNRNQANPLFDDLPVHFVAGRVVRVDKPYVEPINDW